MIPKPPHRGASLQQSWAPAAQAAWIYEFCGLDYDPEKGGQAFTSDKIGQWKNYEPYLDTLRQALGGLAE
jgi:hypothetical protein